jgi:hypothetical protein
MAANLENERIKYAELKMINIRYVAGDLNSLAETVVSPDADIEGLASKLANCIATLQVVRRALLLVKSSEKDNDGDVRSPDASGPHRNVRVGESNPRRYFRGAVSPSNSDSQPLKPRIEIRFQILDIFEADGKAQGGSRRIPRRRAAIASAVERNDKALKATP